MNMQRAIVFLKQILLLLLALNVISLLWAALSHRALNADGSYFFFRLMEERKFIWDVNYLRIFSSVLQLPSVIVMWLGPETKSNVIPSLLYDLAFNLHPILSLYLCYRILKRFDRIDYFLFPVLSFVLCTQALMSYPTLIVPETLSLYWPLFTLMIFRKGDTRWETPLLCALLFCMAFSYEVALLLFLLNIAILIFRRRNHLATRTSDLILISLNFFGFCFMLWRLFRPHAGRMDQFIFALRLPVWGQPFRVVGMAAIGALSLCIPIGYYVHKLRFLLSLSLVSLGLLLVFYFFGYVYLREDLTQIYSGAWLERTTAIPFSCAIACLFAFAASDGVSSWWSQRTGIYFGVSFLTCSALVISLGQDLMLTHIWRSTYDRVQFLRINHPGCNIISPELMTHYFEHPYMAGGYWLPLYTLAPEKSLAVTSIFFVENSPTGDSCRPNSQSTQAKMSFDIGSSLNNFNLRAIVTGSIRIHEWDNANQQPVTREVAR